MCVLGPASNLSKNSCVLPRLDQGIEKTTIQKIMRNGPRSPQWRLIVTNQRLIATNRRLIRLIGQNQRLIATNRPEFVTILRLGLRTLKGVGKPGDGKHTIKPLPKRSFGPPPPPMIRFEITSPPFVHALSFSSEVTGTTQTYISHFLILQNWFWRARSIVRSPPPNRTMRFAPPPFSQED